MVKDNEKDVYICRCEEVTKRELEKAIKNGAATMDELKRMTTAGMGLCQGRSCSRNVMHLLAEKTGAKAEDLRLASHRPPLRPVKAGVFNYRES